MHRFAPYSLLALLSGSLVSTTVAAENIDLLMSNLFPREELTYIGFDSVERVDIPATSGVDRKYLIVDFRSGDSRDREQELASVHRVCTTLLKNRDLIQDLTLEGYDMVAVAFDRNYQYDCL